MDSRPGRLTARLALLGVLAWSIGLARAQPPAQAPAPNVAPTPSVAPTPANPPAVAPPAPAANIITAPVPGDVTLEGAPANVVKATPTPTPTPTPQVALPVGPPAPVRSPIAVLRVLDKVTAETMRFEAPVGRHVRYKSLIFTVSVCETRGPNDAAPRPSAYVVIDSQPPAPPGYAPPPMRQVFKGWMFAGAPGLHPFEHPVYDAWLEVCGGGPAAPAASPTPIAPAPA